MASRTRTYQQIPWVGGLNLTDDLSLMSPNQLSIADSIEFGERASKKKREGINQDYDSGSDGSDTVIGLHDFWYGSTLPKTQRKILVTTGKAVYSDNAGTRSADIFSGTAWGTTPTIASLCTFTNLCIIAVDGGTNIMKKWDGTTFSDLGGTPPTASIVRKHQGRLWCNSKANIDTVYYSTTGNCEEWNGTGDSGSLPIGVGDGDEGGITAIFPTFNGVLYVAKKTKLYRVEGDAPENYSVTEISDSLGCVSHNSIASIDDKDLFFVSDRGVHSIATTDKFGDLESEFVSLDIQKYFNDSFTKSRRKYIWGAYNSNKNSYAIAVTDADISATANNAVWTFHLPTKSWARYAKNFGVSTLITAQDSDKVRWYGGSTTGRLWQFNTGRTYDTNGSGTDIPIIYKIKTGKITPTGDWLQESAFKWLGLWFTQTGSYTLTVTIQIDNYDEQVLLFSDNTGTDLVGSTFIVGTSIVGGTSVAAPYILEIDGLGHLISIQIENSGVNDPIEMLGYAFGFEPVGLRNEVITSAS